jgi:predicted O-methyltransferase YrrM
LSDARGFAQAMADVGRQSAQTTAEALDLSGARRLLDLGGGPGIYALEFARRYPALQATVFDLEDTVRVARENIRRAGLQDRVSVVAGDAFADDLGGPYDLIFVSNLVHIYSAQENLRLVGRCAAALAPGGRLCIKDFILDADGTSPPGGALFAVNMLVSTEGGDCYPLDQVKGWLEAAGLVFESITDLTPQSRLIRARRG